VGVVGGGGVGVGVSGGRVAPGVAVGTSVLVGSGVPGGTAVGILVGAGVAVTTITQGVAVGPGETQAAAVMTKAIRNKTILTGSNRGYMTFPLLATRHAVQSGQAGAGDAGTGAYRGRAAG